jgi:Zn-dependent peptidase ImmA (M78 family)
VAFVRRKHIRTVVENLLKVHKVRSMPVDVEQIARELNIEVLRKEGPDDLSGFLLRDAKRKKAVIGVNPGHHPKRQRFTIAHEIAHFLLHEGEQVHLDRGNFGIRVKLRDKKSSEGTDVDEKEANLFAAELLMPTGFLEQDLADKDAFPLLDEEAIQALADKYEVSAQALTFRLAYLGHIQL